MSRTTTTFRCPDDLREHLQALADREGVDLSVVLVRLLDAGRAANPVDPGELVASRQRATNRRAGRTPGLVIPLSPLALANANDAVATQASVTDATEAKDGVEKMGIHRLTRCAPKLRAA